MKGILIDPFTETISEIEHSQDYKEIYRVLSHEAVKVDCFSVVSLSDTESLFVDDEGLLKDPKYFFMYDGYPQPLAGKGLILGLDQEGDSISTQFTVEDIKKKVSFRNDLRVEGFEETQGIIDHPALGEKTNYFGSVPVFSDGHKEEENDTKSND